ncbi:MAG TPA: YiiD C-terminal domain-containing protein [Aeromicrobium sp.]|nr:YiiD C-terminal domain-containing protein [Aeromicrobium sp.]
MTTSDLDAASMAILNSIPITAAMGIQVVKLEPGTGALEAPPEPNVNHAGMMYAGTLFTLGELLGGLLPPVTWDIAGYVPVVAGLDIKFRRPAYGTIRATATVADEDVQRVRDELAAGEAKIRFPLASSLTDESGTEVATTVGQYVLLKMDGM